MIDLKDAEKIQGMIDSSVEKALNDREEFNAFNVDHLTPYHTHNGVDSSLLDGTSIVNGVPPRVVSVVSSATPTPNVNATDLFELTAQTATAAFQNPIGNPVNGQLLRLRITSSATGTPRPLTWDTKYSGNSPALPSTTTTGKTTTVGFEYDTVNSVNVWRLLWSSNS